MKIQDQLVFVFLYTGPLNAIIFDTIAEKNLRRRIEGTAMPVAISVGPPAITINQGNTFMVTDLRGEIDDREEHGVFARDTRFISTYRLTISQAAWTLLSSSAVTYHSAGFEFVNPTLQTEDGELIERSIGMSVAREIAQAIDETITVT